MSYSSSAETGAAKSSASRRRRQPAEHPPRRLGAFFHEVGTPRSVGVRFHGEMPGRPTVRQVYALAAALCERMGEEFPASGAAASELIERLRRENGHPAPALEDTPLRRRGFSQR